VVKTNFAAYQGRPAHHGPMVDFRVGSMATGSGSGFEVGAAPGVVVRGVGVRRGGAIGVETAGGWASGRAVRGASKDCGGGMEARSGPRVPA